MSRLIDADMMKRAIKGYFKGCIETYKGADISPVDTSVDLIRLVDMVCDAETVDAVPVVHGHWIPKLIPTGVSAFGVDEMTCEEEECSVCHNTFWVGEEKKYCPNCGAKMVNERKEDES